VIRVRVCTSRVSVNSLRFKTSHNGKVSYTSIMILVYDTTPLMHSIITLPYYVFCRISMQMCVYDVFTIKFSSFTCYDTVSYFDTTLIYILINLCATTKFCQHGIYGTLIDTPIVVILRSMV
jgi:hypothetical protein